MGMKYKIMIILVILSILVAGCHVVPDDHFASGKNASPKILPGLGGVAGVVIQGNDDQPVEGKPVHLAGVFRNGHKAAYIFDAANSPSTITNENGEFTFSSIPSGEYVIILGDQMSTPQIISDTDGKAQVWAIQPDLITNTDQIRFVQE
jgi:hypothetical protein